jgi:putative nucleotidyltransferase-like protein
MPQNSIGAIQREKQLVIALSRLPVEAGKSDHIRELIAGCEWREIIDQATRWEVEPAVFGNLRTHFADATPPEVLAEITELERTQRAYAVSQTLQVVDLSKTLTAAGIPTIVLKGPAVAIMAYDDCSRRTFSDIDLLVQKDDLTAARDLLLARGYTPKFTPQMVGALVSGQHALEFIGPGPSVEVHWSLLSRHLRFDLGPDELWQDACRLKCVGSEITSLAPHHLFLYLCAHGAKHEWMRFRWICDVAQLARRLTRSDVERVMDLAGRTNSKRIVALALRLARETFGEEQSPFPPEAFPADRDTDALVAVARARFDTSRGALPTLLPERLASLHPYVAPLTFWIRSRERRRDKLVCAARFVFEPVPRESGAGLLSTLMRPARLAANALMRAVHAS